MVALAPDLFFATKIEASLRAAGHEVALVSRPAEAQAAAADADVLIVDLQAPGFDPLDAIKRLRADRVLDATATLGFYSHVDSDTRQRAEDAGFDLVVPRSRLARKLPELVARLLRGARVRPD